MIDPARLGTPDDLAAVAPVETPPLPGDFGFLYSAQADQRSFRYPLDASDREGRWQGSFRPALTQALRADAGASWVQVLATTRAAMQRGVVRQDPDGEGPLLQAAVFGAGAATELPTLAAAQGVTPPVIDPVLSSPFAFAQSGQNAARASAKVVGGEVAAKGPGPGRWR